MLRLIQFFKLFKSRSHCILLNYPVPYFILNTKSCIFFIKMELQLHSIILIVLTFSKFTYTNPAQNAREESATADQNENKPGNLRLTFDTIDDIPQAFAAQEFRNEERTIYSACQDGSGGVCVLQGQCPEQFKPKNVIKKSPRFATCPPGDECCFKVPSNKCKVQGGECVSRERCGNGQRINSTEDCSESDGNVCCVWTF